MRCPPKSVEGPVGFEPTTSGLKVCPGPFRPVISNTALTVWYLKSITPSRPIPPDHPSVRPDGRQNGDKCSEAQHFAHLGLGTAQRASFSCGLFIPGLYNLQLHRPMLPRRPVLSQSASSS